MSILKAHVGHSVTILDDNRLRCETCRFTLVLPASGKSTSTSFSDPHTNSKDQTQCQEHRCALPCRGCASDLLAGEKPERHDGPRGPIDPRLAAQVRATLALKHRRKEAA